MIIDLFGCTVGTGLMLFLIIRMAVFALPAFVAVTAGGLAFETGAGWAGAIIVGGVAAIATFLGAQGLLALLRSPAARIALAAALAAPSAYAGYYVALGLSGLGGAEGIWRTIFAVGGGAVIGFAAAVILIGHRATDDAVIGGPLRGRLGSSGAR